MEKENFYKFNFLSKFAHIDFKFVVKKLRQKKQKFWPFFGQLLEVNFKRSDPEFNAFMQWAHKGTSN